MLVKRPRMILLGTLVASLTFALTGTCQAASSPALFSRTTLSYSTSLTTAQEAARYQVMVLQSTNGSEVAALHAANPNLKILMYADALHSSSSDPSGWGTCTAYSTDTADPTWFLKNQDGDTITSGNERFMDMGNSAYQAACVSHAVTLAKKYGFNGIMFGGVDASSSWVVPSGTTVEKYPTTSDWEAAMQSFLNYAGKTVQADGLTVMAELTGASTQLWEQWTAPLDGSAEEGWTDAGSGTVDELYAWKPQLASASWSEANDKYALLSSDNQTLAGNTYGLASMLLVANGYSSYETNNGGNGETWYSTYSTAQELGEPLGSYTQLSNGVYERQFQNGIVLVNPTDTTVSSFSLGGGYYTPGGSTYVSSESMAPTTGLILLDGPSGALFNRTTFDYSSSFSTSTEANRYQVMVMQANDYAEADALEAANPNLKVLMYSMAMSSGTSADTDMTTCTQYQDDPSSWVLRNQDGDEIESDGRYLMDWGDTAYQQACVSNAVALAKKYGFDGVMFDGLNSEWQWVVPSGTTVEKYPTTSEWDAAQQSFLNYAGKTVQADGLTVMANLGGTSEALWEQWTTPLNGSSEQQWTDAGQGVSAWLYWWPTKLAAVAWSEANGKYAVLNSWNQTEAGNTFGLASMMLVAKGKSSYATDNNNFGSYEAWYPEYTSAQELGGPTGTYTELSNGVYERKFEDGIVLVNPTTKAVSSFSLGASYEGAGVSPTSSVSLGAASALILTRTPA